MKREKGQLWAFTSQLGDDTRISLQACAIRLSTEWEDARYSVQNWDLGSSVEFPSLPQASSENLPFL